MFKHILIVIFILCAHLAGCATDEKNLGSVFRIGHPLPAFEIIGRQTLAGVGAVQGVAVRNGYIYVFGDAETGVIREYTFRPAGPSLAFTGREILLTRGGVDLLPHPTGLTFHDSYPALIGDTVSKVGTLFWIDFDRALADGDLEDAVLRRIDDDLASDGCRPEFMRYDERLVIVTSDHNASPNELRLYDPAALRAASRTSDPGVLIDRWTCGPFVQSIRWMGEEAACVLVQNQIRGLRYRLALATLDPETAAIGQRVLDLDEPADELEGFLMLTPEIGLCVSAMHDQNATFLRVQR